MIRLFKRVAVTGRYYQSNYKCNFFTPVYQQHGAEQQRCYSLKITEEILDDVEEPSLNVSINLRSYQQECVQSIMNKLNSGKRQKLAVSIATGGGKTVIFSSLIAEILKMAETKDDTRNGFLILVHRKELAEQTINTIKRLGIVSDDRIYLDMGKSKIHDCVFDNNTPFIIVGSIGTLGRNNCKRMENYDASSFLAVIIDECHHSTSQTYLNILARLNCLKYSTRSERMIENYDFNQVYDYDPHLLGFSATLQRSDRLPLKDIFDEIVFEKTISSLIEENHLCNFDWMSVELGLHLDKIESSGGDFVLNTLAKHVNTVEVNETCIKTYKKFKMDNPDNFKSTLIFGCNVQHIEVLCLLFRHNGIHANYVTGATRLTERTKIINDFKLGKINVLLNCGVFTEGTDIPNIDSIFLLRPTKSAPLLTQMVGRGLRNSPGKKKLIVVDFVDCFSVGLAVTSKLTGKRDILNLLSSEIGSGFHSKDEPLPGEIDFLKFKHFAGYKLLIDSNNKSKTTELMKYMTVVNKIGKYYWVRSNLNTWVMSSEQSYFKIELTRTGYCLSLMYNFYSRTGDKKNKKIDICEVQEAEELIPKLDEYLKEHDTLEMYLLKKKRQLQNMKKSLCTENQKSFILKIFDGFINRYATDYMDIPKITVNFHNYLKYKMSKYEASNIILAYIASGNKSLFIYVREKYLKNKESRDEFTKIDEKN